MITPLLIAAIILFVAHVLLIFTSFGKTKGYQPLKYFWSHATLWLAGILVSIILFQYAGTGAYPVTDAFDTPLKKALPIIVAFGLSLIAHAIVKFLVLPAYSGNQGDRR